MVDCALYRWKEVLREWRAAAAAFPGDECGAESDLILSLQRRSFQSQAWLALVVSWREDGDQQTLYCLQKGSSWS